MTYRSLRSVLPFFYTAHTFTHLTRCCALQCSSVSQTPQKYPFPWGISTWCNTCSVKLSDLASQTAPRSVHLPLHSSQQRVPVVNNEHQNAINVRLITAVNMILKISTIKFTSEFKDVSVMVGVLNGLALHGKFLRPWLGAFDCGRSSNHFTAINRIFSYIAVCKWISVNDCVQESQTMPMLTGHVTMEISL